MFWIKRKNNCQHFNSDIPFGYQDVDPMFLLVLAEALANKICLELPSSLLNSYGNWLQMVGQIIQTFNVQQEYQQSGPGRYYNPANRNISILFVTEKKAEMEEIVK